MNLSHLSSYFRRLFYISLKIITVTINKYEQDYNKYFTKESALYYSLQFIYPNPFSTDKRSGSY